MASLQFALPVTSFRFQSVLVAWAKIDGRGDGSNCLRLPFDQQKKLKRFSFCGFLGSGGVWVVSGCNCGLSSCGWLVVLSLESFKQFYIVKYREKLCSWLEEYCFDRTQTGISCCNLV